MKRLLLACAAAAACIATSAMAGASTKLAQLPESYLLSALPAPAPRFQGELRPLRAGVSYSAHNLPVAMRLTPRDASWTGAQWKSARLGFRGGGPPYFGWVAVGERGSTGLVVITTAYDRTPSVARTVARLRSRGRWATYQPSSPVKLAGFSGVQFDGQVASGRLHVFAPFTDGNHFQDAFFVADSELFRVIVLDVRGKTVVVFVDGVGLSPDEFPTFLARANRLLQSLRFPS